VRLDEVPVLSSQVRVVNTARNLGVVVDTDIGLTPVMRQLHWLPVRRHVMFKLATLVHRSLAGTAPTCDA